MESLLGLQPGDNEIQNELEKIQVVPQQYDKQAYSTRYRMSPPRDPDKDRNSEPAET